MTTDTGSAIMNTALNGNGAAGHRPVVTDLAFTPGNGGLLVPVITHPAGNDGPPTVSVPHGNVTRNGHGNGAPVPRSRYQRRRTVRRTPIAGNGGAGNAGNGGNVSPPVAKRAPAPSPRHARDDDEPTLDQIAQARQHVRSHARALLTVVVAIVASLGQVEFAREKQFTEMIQIPQLNFPGLAFIPAFEWNGYDLTPWFAVAIFDLAVAALLSGGREAYIRKGLTPWPFWIVATALAGVSVYTNSQHDGHWITAPASGVLFALWFMTLLYDWLRWRQDDREAKGLTADDMPSFIFSRLMITDRELALLCWKIAGERAIGLGVAYRKSLGEKVKARDLVVTVARLYRDVLNDRMVVEHEEAERQGANKPRRQRRRLRQQATKLALMCASDNVDLYLGQPVPERGSIQVHRINYVNPEPPAFTPPAAPPSETDSPQDEQLNERPVPKQTKTKTPPPPPPADTDSNPEPVSAPPGDVPDVPAAWFDLYANQIHAVQKAAGDAWWNGAKPLTVGQVRAYGKGHSVGNTKTAMEVRRCLVVLRAQKLADMASVPQPDKSGGGA